MNRIASFIKTTLVGGFLFLLPLILIAFLVQHGIVLAGKVLAPITDLLPKDSIFGYGLPDVIAVALLLLAGFAAGLLARTRLGGYLSSRSERLILSKMPGFSLIKSAAQGLANVRTSDSVKVALARIDDAWLLAFIVETHDDGMLTVFIPSAPTPAAGTIYFLQESQVKLLDVPLASAVKCVMQLGVGSKELLDGQRLIDPASPEK